MIVLFAIFAPININAKKDEELLKKDAGVFINTPASFF